MKKFLKHILTAVVLVWFATYGNLPAKVARSYLVGMSLEKIVGITPTKSGTFFGRMVDSVAPTATTSLVATGRVAIGVTVLILLLIGAWGQTKLAFASSGEAITSACGAPVNFVLTGMERKLSTPFWQKVAGRLIVGFLLLFSIWFLTA